jgi:ATP-binding cassette subfamily B protein/subfamily B ATP-binding cassette protein MsbA
LWPYWHLAAITGVLVVIGSCVELLGPWPWKFMLDNVFGNFPLPGWLASFFNPQNKVPLLIAVVIAELVIALAHNLLHVASNYVDTNLEQRMNLDFRSDLFQHAQRLSLAFHDRRRSGMLIYAINSQGEAAASLVMSVPAIAYSAITLLGMFWIVFRMDWGLALLATCVLPFLFYSVRYYTTRIQDRLMHTKMLEGESLSIIHEAISMLRVIVAFGREPYEYQRFREQAGRAVDARVGITIRQTLFSLVVNMTTALGTAAVMGYGGYRVLQGRLSPGDLTVVMFYLAKVYQPLESISYTFGTLQDKFVSLKIAFDVLDTVPEVREPAHARMLERAEGRLEFQGIDFAYAGRNDTLRNISFEVEPGKTVAIVGPTGAGKTTLISLIPRFYDAHQGRILLDGIDITELGLKSLRNQLSFVLQEPLLFSGSIQENIRYGRLEASDEEVIEAAKAANAHDFIMRLPEQYRTELGERGAQLSGGERQRICVARAFLKDAPILVLDEPTSAIDSKTEAVILDALDRLMIGRTSFMIAHRLSTVHRADLILVMDQGRIVQRGTHDELVAADGLYRQLHEIQNRAGRRRAAAGGEPRA